MARALIVSHKLLANLSMHQRAHLVCSRDAGSCDGFAAALPRAALAPEADGFREAAAAVAVAAGAKVGFLAGGTPQLTPLPVEDAPKNWTSQVPPVGLPASADLLLTVAGLLTRAAGFSCACFGFCISARWRSMAGWICCSNVSAQHWLPCQTDFCMKVRCLGD